MLTKQKPLSHLSACEIRERLQLNVYTAVEWPEPLPGEAKAQLSGQGVVEACLNRAEAKRPSTSEVYGMLQSWSRECRETGGVGRGSDLPSHEWNQGLAHLGQPAQHLDSPTAKG